MSRDDENPWIPNGWTESDLMEARRDMERFTGFSKAYYLLAHRIGFEQRRQAAIAIPNNPAITTHESKIAAGAAYKTFDSVLNIVAEIASFEESKDEQQQPEVL